MSAGGYTVVVDGGGTGTRVRLHDSVGRTVAEARSGPSSLSLGIPQAWESVGAAVREACTSASIGAPEALGLRMVAGFAGGRSPTNRAEFRMHDRLGCREIGIVTDGFASLFGAFGGEPGVVLAIGTGVTAYALLPGGAVCETSGWGFPAGDEGGGAWIGHRALQAHLKRLDGRLATDSAMFGRIAAIVGHEFDAIQLWLARARSTQYALLAPAVTVSAAEGDALAEAILVAATAELEQALAAVDRVGSSDRIAVLGGLAQTLVPRLGDRVRRRIVAPRGSALDGLRLIAARGLTSEMLA